MWYDFYSKVWEFSMRKKSFILYGVVLALLFAGCAQKTQIKAIKAAKVSDSAIKNIGVMPFANDSVSQSAQIDAAIAGVEIDGSKYFNLVDRENIKKVMEEKKLNESGLVDLVSDDSDMGLMQIQTLVSGRVNASSMATSRYLETRTDYSTCVRSKKTKSGKTVCSQYRKYRVHCQANNYSVSTQVKLVKVSNSSTLFAKTYTASSKKTRCDDSSKVLPTKSQQNTALAGDIAKQVLRDIAPSYVYFSVTLLEDPDLDYSDAQEILLENALELIEQKRVEKARELLQKLNNSLGGQSYVALYNLAVTEEALGHVEEAYHLLQQAEDIALQTALVEEISVALERTKRNLNEQRKAQKQLGL